MHNFGGLLLRTLNPVSMLYCQQGVIELDPYVVTLNELYQMATLGPGIGHPNACAVSIEYLQNSVEVSYVFS